MRLPGGGPQASIHKLAYVSLMHDPGWMYAFDTTTYMVFVYRSHSCQMYELKEVLGVLFEARCLAPFARLGQPVG